ncbi:hypothetical protein IWW50_006260 [Coemansia erecta]|nr:hypothetical protein GGF43_005550 [Coemansia sp. RSA 2618]KAJ2817154.1 hypothetical protein IWW50_006260 [Coemansia erecta]
MNTWIRASRHFTTTAFNKRVSDEFVKQFRLPGRTNSVLSSGVVPYSNDPMVPRDKYFKPRGLARNGRVLALLRDRHPSVLKHNAPRFLLYMIPWSQTEHPRDHNGLRIRDYRVAIIAAKKHYRTAHRRWRATRLVRTAAALVLPDKGATRCDYLFVLHAGVLDMDRDELFFSVEAALVDVERRNGRRRGAYEQRPACDGRGLDVSAEMDGNGNGKILNAPSARSKSIYSISEIVEDLG